MIRIGQQFDVPYKRYNKECELEKAYDSFRVVSIYDDGRVLARHSTRKRHVKVFSKEEIEEYIEKYIKKDKEILLRLKQY